ncbi:DNA-directed RNA polymerase I kDa polypeptide [Mycena leptocephala]|nr:DNA-directed RNA polymerase I kDa polypeptide [Mycena leptocephala]
MVGAHKIGSLLFCPKCGTLLELPKDGQVDITCEQCTHVEPASSYENTEITTRSDPDAFPSALRQKRKTQTKLHDMEIKAPWWCGRGSTIFYTCVACKHGWRVNN